MSTTGRFRVYSPKTGITYVIEPLIEGDKVGWGDMDPADKKLKGSYGLKHIGAVHRSESIITNENGFVNITELPPGVSPMGEIDRIDQIRYDQGYRPNQDNSNPDAN